MRLLTQDWGYSNPIEYTYANGRLDVGTARRTRPADVEWTIRHWARMEQSGRRPWTIDDVRRFRAYWLGVKRRQRELR